MGGVFLINYFKEQIKKGYDLNKYEIEARKISGENIFCQTNYTKCVRNGEALIYNPNFKK